MVGMSRDTWGGKTKREPPGSTRSHGASDTGTARSLARQLEDAVELLRRVPDRLDGAHDQVQTRHVVAALLVRQQRIDRSAGVAELGRLVHPQGLLVGVATGQPLRSRRL